MEAYLDYQSIECVPLLKENTKVNNMFVVLQIILTYIVLIESNHVIHLPPCCAISENCLNFSRFRRLKMSSRIFLFGYGRQLGWINQSCIKWLFDVFTNFSGFWSGSVSGMQDHFWRGEAEATPPVCRLSHRGRENDQDWKDRGEVKIHIFPLRLSIYQRCSAESQSR